ncbi:hypothetical protein BKP56_12785 [Marinilactibacillus sp. 15R]|uniref:hypothetical protein n=2 Tax=Marinilactibacillus TaxID=191769 RepID=UPI00090C38BF|nr:hypothetical protein [Marinilactibacillus sp. 15R]API90077.1 hypothetical protein BKP56_12785 [Marinilactibacillus sp. 15R]
MYDEQRNFQEDKSDTPGNHLKYYIGTEGLIRLLRLLGDDKVINRQELITLVQRIQVPGYDIDLNSFDEAYAES